MKKISNYYGNLNFQKKIVFTYSLISLIPILFLGIFCYFQSKSFLIKQEEQNLKTTIEQLSTSIDYSLETYDSVSNYVTFNKSIQNSLKYDYDSNYFNMGQTYDNLIDPMFSSMKTLYPGLKEVTIYSNSNLSDHGNILKPVNYVYDKDWYPVVMSDFNIHWFSDIRKNLLCIRQLPIFNKKVNNNILYLEINMASILHTSETSLGKNYGLIVTNSKNEVIYSNDYFDEAYSHLKLSEDQVLKFSQDSTNNTIFKNYSIVSNTLKNSDWNIILYRPINFIAKDTTSIIYTLLIVVSICILILFILSILLSRVIVDPLKKLTKSMHEVKNGNFDIKIYSPNTDELGVLTNAFQDMIVQINYLIKEVYESNLLQQKLKFKALQAQINPHFLYNCLSLINWKAIIAGQSEISQMSQLLSTFYRTSLNKGKNITSIKEEIENTKSYIEIQLLLHNNKFKVEYNLDEKIYYYCILNLTLQPLIENAISHGLNLKESDEKILLISASLLEKSNIIELYIEDNGIGINETLLPDLLSMKSKGYGLKNINDRIQLYFGNSFGLSIESKEGIGTKITIRIPATSLDEL